MPGSVDRYCGTVTAVTAVAGEEKATHEPPKAGRKIFLITFATRVGEVARVAAGSAGKFAWKLLAITLCAGNSGIFADEPGAWRQRGGR